MKKEKRVLIKKRDKRKVLMIQSSLCLSPQNLEQHLVQSNLNLSHLQSKASKLDRKEVITFLLLLKKFQKKN
jgi:hypothetical protein